MEKNIKNYKEENENLRLQIELCNRQLLLKQKELEVYRLKSNCWKRKSKVCKKRKSKVQLNFNPINLKDLKPNEINPCEITTNEINNDFKNVPEIKDLYEEAPDIYLNLVLMIKF